MKQTTFQQSVLVGVLGIFVAAAVFALVIIYMGYLPTILSFPWHKSDATTAEYSYRIARNSFIIAAVSGIILGLAVPVIFRTFKKRYGRHAA